MTTRVLEACEIPQLVVLTSRAEVFLPLHWSNDPGRYNMLGLTQVIKGELKWHQ